MANCYGKLMNNLEDLGLNGIRDRFGKYLSALENGQKDITEVLCELTDYEKALKKERMINACVKTAGFPYQKDLNDFEFDFQSDLDKGQIMELNTLRFIEAKENIIFIGTPGTGKTHLSVALGTEAAKNGFSTYFIECHELLEQLKRASQENRLEAKLKQYSRYRLLIIDEIGYLNLESDAGNLLFQLISRRYEKKSTIITTNIGFSRWGELFNDPVIANAILDRLLHHCHVISINGPSYRTRKIPELTEERRGDSKQNEQK